MERALEAAAEGNGATPGRDLLELLEVGADEEIDAPAAITIVEIDMTTGGMKCRPHPKECEGEIGMIDTRVATEVVLAVATMIGTVTMTVVTEVDTEGGHIEVPLEETVVELMVRRRRAANLS